MNGLFIFHRDFRIIDNISLLELNKHCNNIYTSLTHKRQKIDIEYKKYSNLFNTLLSYYYNFSKYINKQSNNMNVLEFCTNNSISIL